MKVILANITTISGQMYLLAKIHDVGGPEHVTAVRYIMHNESNPSSLGRYVFGSEISYNKAPPRLPGLGC
jgi:hypothetical protein